ncbi:Urb2/Npa2 family domain containing protein [Amanita muscaria]
MSVVQSSQDFVRALKAATDPPSAGGPSKFEIARHAWDDVSLYVPSKAELIADWILTKLLKEKGHDRERNPILDIRYWKLLADVIQRSSDPRPSKTWLGAILIRVPIAPIVSSFLGLYAQCNTRQDELIGVVASCLHILWPPGVQKITTETLLECFGISLPLIQGSNTSHKLVNLITNSYRSSFANNSNKRKLFHLFSQHHFHQWLECMASTLEDADHAQLLDIVYNAGVETLYNPDVLRQSLHPNTENPVLTSFQEASKSSKTDILSVLPRLFSSFLQSIKKYRTSLFGQGSAASTTQESNAVSMRFFITCQSFLGSSIEAWRARSALLVIVRENNLLNRPLLEATASLGQICELAIASLSESANPALALDCLCTLTRIDHDIVLPTLPSLLPRLLQIRHCDQFVTFLDLLLDYYTKTRTIPDYISNLLNIPLSPKHIAPVGYCDDPCEIYQSSSASVLLHPIHLDRLAKKVQSFVTSSQTLQLAKTIVEMLETAWADFGTAARHQMRSKVDPVSPQILSVRFSLLATFASVVLVSLPVRSLPNEERTALDALLNPLRREFVAQVIRKLSKVIRDDRPAWEWQICAAAALRLGYFLDVSRNLALPHSDCDPKFTKRVMELAGNRDLLPELSLESFRYLLSKTTVRDRIETERLFDDVLAYIEQSLSPAKSRWSGHTYQLTYDDEGKASSALALLHMLVERWLPVIDAYASGEQLKRFVGLLLGVGLDETSSSPNRSELRPQDVLVMILRSAQFWELLNIRPIFLSTVIDSTSSLDESSDTARTVQAASLYRFLLYVPMEYLSKPSRTELVKRALSADILLSANTAADTEISYLLTILRIFLNRAFTYTGSVQPSVFRLARFLEHLVNSKSTEVDTTLDLIKLYFREVLRNVERDNKDVLRVFELMKTWAASEASDLGPKAVVRMIECMTREFSINSFPEDVRTIIGATHKQLTADTLPQMTLLVDRAKGPGKSNDTIALWTCLLSFGYWLGGQQDGIQLFGLGLASSIISRSKNVTTMDDEMRVMALAMTVQELQCIPESEQAAQLERIIAVYASFASDLDEKGWERLDVYLSRACNIVSASTYAHVLNLVSEMLASPSPERMLSIVHLAIRLLKDYPQNTLKHTQAFATQCINVFASHDHTFVNGPSDLRIKVLDYVVHLCSERPMALRSNDLSGIWSLLYRFLAPSSVHDDGTSRAIYQRIVSATGALVRLRRDLVKWTLPHLAQMLRQLTLCLRACRPLLGAKQTAMVMDTQPRWISAKQALGVEEAKALSRLMETVETKTVVRTYYAQSETKKAESLGKPFSKHAVYVVKAYVECMNDPLCVMSAEVRRELEPGLFALCGMVSDHSRDAVMASALDTGGKAVMKALWKEYEKQKYVGQG